MSKLLKPKEIAEKLNVSLPQVYAMIRNGDLPVVRIGRCVRVREIDVENFILIQLEQNNKNQTSWANSQSGLQDDPTNKKEQSHDL